MEKYKYRWVFVIVGVLMQAVDIIYLHVTNYGYYPYVRTTTPVVVLSYFGYAGIIVFTYGMYQVYRNIKK